MDWIFMGILTWFALRWGGGEETVRVTVTDTHDDEDTQWTGREIPFDPGDPTVWDEYKGQDRVKELLKITLGTLHVSKHPKILLAGPKGTGKTALARLFSKYYHDAWRKALGEEFKARYIETTPAMFSDKKDLDGLMRAVGLWDVVFFDEVHMFPRQLADTLLPAIEDNLYPFPGGMSELPSAFCWIAATTDLGMLPEAFIDRFMVLNLEPLELEDLRNIVQMQPMAIEDDAAWEIASRSAGYPREVKRLYARARDVAVNYGGTQVEMPHADMAFRLLGLDKNGLYPEERRVLEVPYKQPKRYAPRANGVVPLRYAQSEKTIRTLTGLDENHYKSVESKLMRLGYLTIGTAGRELTPKALEEYFGVKDETKTQVM